MRLGPFPSVRQALKFATFSALAVVAGSLFGPLWSVPLLGGGFVLAAYRAGGEGLDERAAARLGFSLRSRGRPLPHSGEAARGPYGSWVPGRLIAVVATGGVPVAFLPPNDARSLFDHFRTLLNHLPEGVVIVAGVDPVHLEDLPETPSTPLAGSLEANARHGYAEMRRLLAQKRHHRRVLLALWVDARPAGAARQLDRSAERLSEDLRQMGLVPERVRDRALLRASTAFGWGASMGR
jgi:hypothetical protein